jgi:hypothetical protein
MVSCVLTACVAIKSLIQRDELANIYGRYEVYRLLRDSKQFSLFRVNMRPAKSHGITSEFLLRATKVHCGLASKDNASRLRELLTTPTNFQVDFVKSYVFVPTVVLTTEEQGDYLECYFCFESNMAAIVLNNQLTGVLATDNVASELRHILSVDCLVASNNDNY